MVRRRNPGEMPLEKKEDRKGTTPLNAEKQRKRGERLTSHATGLSGLTHCWQ